MYLSQYGTLKGEIEDLVVCKLLYHSFMGAYSSKTQSTTPPEIYHLPTKVHTKAQASIRSYKHAKVKAKTDESQVQTPSAIQVNP